nr:hypothetical protein [Natronomonas marina]
MEFDFTRSVVPLAAIVAVATVALTSAMAPSTVFMMVLPSVNYPTLLAHGFFSRAEGPLEWSAELRSALSPFASLRVGLSRGLLFWPPSAAGEYSPFTFNVPRFKRTFTGAPPPDDSRWRNRENYCRWSDKLCHLYIENPGLNFW